MIELFPSREVVLELFGWSIRWYGVLYVVAIWLAWVLLPRLQKYRGLNLTRDQWTYLLAWAVAGVLVGGRLGYVLFYEPSYFLSHPGEILAIWSGGMSSHGGMIGVAIALWLGYRSKWLMASSPDKGRVGGIGEILLRIDFLRILDIAVIPAVLGLALGRIGNGINQELFIDNAWLYAVAANLIIAGVCCLQLVIATPPLFVHKQGRGEQSRRLQTLEAKPPRFGVGVGSTTALFLILYSIQRFLIEYVRIQDWPLTLGLTRGQLLTVPIFLLGVLLFYSSIKRNSYGERKSVTPHSYES